MESSPQTSSITAAVLETARQANGFSDGSPYSGLAEVKAPAASESPNTTVNTVVRHGLSKLIWLAVILVVGIFFKRIDQLFVSEGLLISDIDYVVGLMGFALGALLLTGTLGLLVKPATWIHASLLVSSALMVVVGSHFFFRLESIGISWLEFIGL